MWRRWPNMRERWPWRGSERDVTTEEELEPIVRRLVAGRGASGD